MSPRARSADEKQLQAQNASSCVKPESQKPSIKRSKRGYSRKEIWS